MNGLVKIAILIALNIGAFFIAGKIAGLICTAIVLYKILNILGFTRSPSLFKGGINEGVVYTKDYIGPYSKVFGPACKECLGLIKDLKLKDYVVIGIYYDRPGTVEESKMRSSIGIYKKNVGFPEKLPDATERILIDKGYNYNEFNSTNSLYSSWEYSNLMTLMMGIKKFYTLLDNKLKDAVFKRQYRVKEEEIKVCIEIYETDSKVVFYVPLIGASKFLFFKKDK